MGSPRCSLSLESDGHSSTTAKRRSSGGWQTLCFFFVWLPSPHLRAPKQNQNRSNWLGYRGQVTGTSEKESSDSKWDGADPVFPFLRFGSEPDEEDSFDRAE